MAKLNATACYSLILLCICCGSDCARVTMAKEKPWYKYENAYFEAYSDASEKKVRRLLEELENFRAALVQVSSITIPEGAVKTQVIIFDSSRDFRNVTDNALVAAFAMGLDGVPHLVMTDNGGTKLGSALIRHEYTHVVLGYSKHRFPLWYHEGFAEFMSGTRFREKGTQFTLGESPGRLRAPARLVAWDELIDGDFDLHAIRSPEVLSNAYLQAWLLVHYLTVGDELAHTDDLNKYLAKFAEGSPSHDAFAAAFGISPDEMGSILISSYGRRIPFYSIAFRSGVQDHDFIRSTADGGAIRETIQQMTDEFSLSAK